MLPLATDASGASSTPPGCAYRVWTFSIVPIFRYALLNLVFDWPKAAAISELVPGSLQQDSAAPVKQTEVEQGESRRTRSTT